MTFFRERARPMPPNCYFGGTEVVPAYVEVRGFHFSENGVSLLPAFLEGLWITGGHLGRAVGSRAASSH